MVDVLVVNVILDMYEFTAIRLSVIETLVGSHTRHGFRVE